LNTISLVHVMAFTFAS